MGEIHIERHTPKISKTSCQNFIELIFNFSTKTFFLKNWRDMRTIP